MTRSDPLGVFNSVAQGVSTVAAVLQTLQAFPFFAAWAKDQSLSVQLQLIEDTLLRVIKAIDKSKILAEQDKKALIVVYDRYADSGIYIPPGCRSSDLQCKRLDVELEELKELQPELLLIAQTRIADLRTDTAEWKVDFTASHEWY